MWWCKGVQESKIKNKLNVARVKYESKAYNIGINTKTWQLGIDKFAFVVYNCV